MGSTNGPGAVQEQLWSLRWRQLAHALREASTAITEHQMMFAMIKHEGGGYAARLELGKPAPLGTASLVTTAAGRRKQWLHVKPEHKPAQRCQTQAAAIIVVVALHPSPLPADGHLL